MSTDVRSGTAAGSEPLIERLRRATIGRYDIYAELGSGGMASVFLALDLALDRKVAIKVMSPALTNSADALERFKREAKVAASLSHPNIIPVYAVGDDPELAYFVMKYIEGRSLDSVIREQGAQSVPFVQMIISYAGNALYYSHQRGVVHRDVKPANFMLDQDGWLIVTDFGIAKMEDGHGLTMSGTLIGTPYYMSPEQFNGQPIAGTSDQYALGIVAFELLTGRTPYNGPTIAEVMRGHLIDDVPPLRSINPEIPQELEDCISRMLAKSPADRFPSLAEAVEAFGAVAPKVEAEVRTQIISLAKLGAAQQPRMSVPLSPIPQKRRSQNAEPTMARRSAAGGPGVSAPSIDPRAPTPKLAARPIPAPEPQQRSSLPWVLIVLLLLGGGAGVVFLRPDLLGLAPRGESAVVSAPPVTPLLIPPPQPDSAALAAAAAAAAPVTPPSAPVVDTAKPKAPTKAPARVPTKAAAKAPTKAVETKVVETKAAEPEPAPAKAEPAPPPVKVETLVVVQQAPPPPIPEPEPVATGPGRVRIGTRLAFAVLSINDKVHGPIGSARGVLNLEVPSGSVRLTIKAENCVDWDTTVVVIPGQVTTVGNRSPRCQ